MTSIFTKSESFYSDLYSHLHMEEFIGAMVIIFTSKPKLFVVFREILWWRHSFRQMLCCHCVLHVPSLWRWMTNESSFFFRAEEFYLKSIWPRYVIGRGFGEVILLDECIKALHDGQSRLQDGGELEFWVRDTVELLHKFILAGSWWLMEQVTYQDKFIKIT